ncbi:MAG: QueT transporter family protein [Clostridia bacterium]|nr:QueT transporter family protein [Clostridia bacterium]
MKNTKFMAQTSLIAALYAVLTLCLAPIGFGIIQFRVSEVLTLLPIFTSAAIPGLAIGCLVSNYIGFIWLGSTGIIDIIFGTIATLLAAICTYRLKNKKFLAPLPPVIFNAIIVGGYLHFIAFPNINIILCMLSIAASEFVITYFLGIPFANIVRKTKIFK